MTTRLPTLAVLLLASATARAQPTTAPRPPETWRLDYYHTGGPSGVEVHARDRLVVEPHPWSGPPNARADTTGPGTYRAELRDTTGRVLWARVYNSVYQEWVTTAEARERTRTFQESLRFPAPPAPAELVVARRSGRGPFREVWRTRVDPADRTMERGAPLRAAATRVEHHGDPARKVDVVLVGDGYTAAECARKFGADARRMTRALFAQEPFRSRRADFNVWGVCPPSPVSGISRPSTGRHLASAVGATYDAFGSERYVLTFAERALREAASAAPYDMVVVLANSATYGGGGIYGAYSTVAVDNDWADYLFVHELAHHVAGLADEYYTSPVAYEAPTAIAEPLEPNVTALLDTAGVKWASLRTAGAPLPTPWPKAEFEAMQRDIQDRRRRLRAQERPEAEMNALFREERARTTALLRAARHAHDVGAFQGANYDARAFYRPEIDCIMFTRDDVGFCAVCRRALSAVIDLFTRA